MAKVWLARRKGTLWIVPGGRPWAELPLEQVRFALDLGPHRRLVRDLPRTAPEAPAVGPEAAEKVFVEVEPEDLASGAFPAWAPGFYDSPYSPREAARRLGAAATPEAA